MKRKNTVLLDVEKYNELRDFKQKIEEKYTYATKCSNYFYEVRYITTDEAIKEIEELNKSLSKRVEDLKSANNPKEITIEDLKRMSYWEFRKWRKS